MEFPGLSGSDIEWLQSKFVEQIFQRIEESKSNRRTPKSEQGKVIAAMNFSVNRVTLKPNYITIKIC